MVDSTLIEANLRAALRADPRIPAPDEIAIGASEGGVTLRGTVGSFGQRRAALELASETEGVADVIDELQVRLLDDHRRSDAEIRGAALQRLMWNVEIPSESVDVKVRDGWVTLTGDVDFQFQSNEAFAEVARLRGVVGVVNQIRVYEPIR